MERGRMRGLGSHRRGKREGQIGWLKKGIWVECLLLTALAVMVLYREGETASRESASGNVLFIEDDYIKWVDFTVSYEALCKAYEWDVETHGTEHEIDWVELLAYTAARTGGKFDRDAIKVMDKTAEKLSEGEGTLEEMTADLKYYSYYKEAYDAAIGGLVGEYWEATPDAGGSGAGEGMPSGDGYRECRRIRRGARPRCRGKGRVCEEVRAERVFPAGERVRLYPL